MHAYSFRPSWYTFQWTIHVWYILSTDCVHASSVNVFNNIADKYLVKGGYAYNKELLYV